MVKTGDRVRVADNKNTRMMHEAMPEFYPEPGSLGTVDRLTPTNSCWVKWDNLQDDHPWAFPGRWLEVVEEELPAITATVKITRDKKYTRVEVDGECQDHCSGKCGWLECCFGDADSHLLQTQHVGPPRGPRIGRCR